MMPTTQYGTVDRSYMRASSTMSNRACLTASIVLCAFGFFKAMRPSEPFLTEYLMGPPMNLTSEQLDGEVYPVWTYSYLVALIPVFLLSDVLRYKPVIIVEAACYIGTWALLLWAEGLHAMRFMQFVYGFATATEIAYYAYPYAAVDREHYQKLTSYTRGFLLTGQFVGSALGQLLISLNVCSYYDLNIISMTSVCIAFVISLFLPSVQRTNYFHTLQRTDSVTTAGDQADRDSIHETSTDVTTDTESASVSVSPSATGSIDGPISVVNPAPGIDAQQDVAVPEEAVLEPEGLVSNDFWEDFNLQDGAGGEIVNPGSEAAVNDPEYNNPQHNKQRLASNASNEFWEDFNLEDGTGAIIAATDEPDYDETELPRDHTQIDNNSHDPAYHEESPNEVAVITTQVLPPSSHDTETKTDDDLAPISHRDFNEVDLNEDAAREFAGSLNITVADDNGHIVSPSTGGIYYTNASSPVMPEQTTTNCLTACLYRNFGPIWNDFKHCYGNTFLLKWSIWWAVATCGNMQVGNYVQILWEHILPSTEDSDVDIYNGAVEAAATLCGAIVVYCLVLVNVNWRLFGELFLGIISIIDAILLISMALTNYIWVAYVFYIIFRASYQMVVTVASFQIASQLNVERYALVFGFNTFIALILQTLITLIVVDDAVLGVPVTTQFIVTGCYFLLMGSIFLTIAIVLLTRIGWRAAWQLRKPDSYRRMDES